MNWLKQTPLVFAISVAALSSFAAGKSSLQVGNTYFVTVDTLNVRSQPNKTAELVGTLATNDQVKVEDLVASSADMVKISIVQSSLKTSSTDLFVSANYLSSQKISGVDSGPQASSGKYFVVQNIATERARVYEKCTTSPGCPNKLVFQTEVVVGRQEGPDSNQNEFLTRAGHYKITKWIKYYEDSEKHYPSWYAPNYPAMPFDADAGDWIGTSYTPDSAPNAKMRGAFGWYAAMVAPDADSQWMHGTYGWGHDGDLYIKYTRKTWVNYFADPRSSGCVRHENRAIAYLRHILPVGTDVYRVYAIEAYKDKSLSRYASQKAPLTWNWTLTTVGAQREGGLEADRDAVQRAGVSPSQILEQGTYQVDRYPSAFPMNPNAGWYRRFRAQSGNTYGISPSNFHGVFLVDEGKFENYRHPQGIGVGGYPDHGIPADLQTTGDYTLPPPLDD